MTISVHDLDVQKILLSEHQRSTKQTTKPNTDIYKLNFQIFRNFLKINFSVYINLQFYAIFRLFILFKLC